MPELTDRAREILARALQAARRLNPDVVIRLEPGPSGVAALLADAPRPGDVELLENVWAAPGVEGVVDGGEHDALVLREG